MIVVTGANGFIGKNFLKRLENSPQTYDVMPVDTHNMYDVFNEKVIPNITKIYHFGAISSTTETDVSKIYYYNIEYSIKLFEMAIAHNIPVVYASSGSVYGNAEYYKINPLNYYSLSKATVDYWVSDNIRKFESVIGLRFFNVYGDGEDNKGNQASPIHQFTKQAKETGVIKVFENSDKYQRDFVWVEDCIDCALMRKDSGIYDVGTNDPISFLEVATIVAQKYNVTIKTIPFPIQLYGRYQYFTRARRTFEKSFKTVEEYVNEL
jgi:ADP-L-glycero-D-manno-heptose 6-epimerase